jgi:hypothetical protein
MRCPNLWPVSDASIKSIMTVEAIGAVAAAVG